MLLDMQPPHQPRLPDCPMPTPSASETASRLRRAKRRVQWLREELRKAVADLEREIEHTRQGAES